MAEYSLSQLQVYINREVEEWLREVNGVAAEAPPPPLPATPLQEAPHWILASATSGTDGASSGDTLSDIGSDEAALERPQRISPSNVATQAPPQPKPVSDVGAQALPQWTRLSSTPIARLEQPPPPPAPKPSQRISPNDAMRVGSPSPERYPSPKHFSITYTPRLPENPVFQENRCIYKVPFLPEVMRKKYLIPSVVSIGPFHHKEQDTPMESLKTKYFDKLVARSGLLSTDYFEAVEERLEEIISCYSERIYYRTEDLVKMIAIDGCFIIEMFHVVEKRESSRLRSMRNLLPYLRRDFMLLENQIPFSILQDFFNMSKIGKVNLTLHDLALNFFKYALPKPSLRFNKLKDNNTRKVEHLLHLLLLSITESLPIEQDLTLGEPWIPSATKLGLGGINVTGRTEDFISIRPDYRRRRLKIPTLILDDFLCCFLYNCVALENNYAASNKHFSAYVNFMKCLISKEADAEHLSSHRVVMNYSGTEADTVNFFKALAEKSIVDIRRSYLADMVYQLNKDYDNKLLQIWAGFCNTYFSSPWSFLSAAAVFVGLLLTAIQAHYAIFPKR